MAGPDYDLLGLDYRMHRFCPGAEHALCSALHTRCSGSRLLPWRAALPDLLDSIRIPCPDRRDLHGRDTGGQLHRLTAFRAAVADGWSPRGTRLAMAVPARRSADRPAWLRLPRVPDGSAEGREMAHRAGAQM